MSFDPHLADIRFGCGLSPRLAAPASAEDMLTRLQGPDAVAPRFSLDSYQITLDFMRTHREARRAERKARTDADRDAATERKKANRKAARARQAIWLGHTLLRRALTGDGFRERLTAFWLDHFTAAGKTEFNRGAHPIYADEAIRPHVAGRFADMLKAVATHPFMLDYLDQRLSAGPNSRVVQHENRINGLNENLAREMLELHTLGVDGPYTQGDVRQLAELLTGLSYGMKSGFRFRPAFVEPGHETILNVSYGGEKGTLDDIFAALDDLARHPATARHLAEKLAVHFVSDVPDPALIDAMTARYAETDGDLVAVYEAMLNHPASWRPGPGNVKQPMDFIGSALRALDIRDRHIPVQNLGRMWTMFVTPMAMMGQTWGLPPGPDGWPEDDAAWITPQRLSARLQWAMTVPFSLIRTLPDPRDFVESALGPSAPESVRFAASAAETRAEGIGVVLAAPAFQRM